MTSAQETIPDRLAPLRAIGLSWRANGEASLRGPLLRLADRMDRALTQVVGAGWGAEEERHPASLPAADLQRVDYLHSFPHQATFPMRLEPDEANLDGFRARPTVDADGQVALTRLAPAREVLTPAACYHLYTQHQGAVLDAPRYLTTRNTCFRGEAHYEPLRRQWSFTMREIVCLGTGAEVASFLAASRSATDLLLARLDLPVTWQTATDPFFRPLENPHYLMQRLEPTKHEAVYGGDLAIGSANLHHEHFGASFAITRDGAPAHTACIAFGIERWLFAVVDRHGPRPESWPDPIRAAEHIAATVAGRQR